MRKLFTVTEDMNSMTHDQLKGAVRNMETISNAMYLVLEEMFNEYETNPDSTNVLTISFNLFSESTKQIILPDVSGHDVIIPSNRPDMLIRWKLHFFSKYGNLNLTCTFEGGGTVQIKVQEYNNIGADGFSVFSNDRMLRERSNAALYESMSNRKSF